MTYPAAPQPVTLRQVRRVRARRAVFLPLLLATASAQALEVSIDPHADLLYRQALPLLEQADNQDASASPLRTASGDPELSRQGQALAHTLPTAVALLKKSVALGHPVAQYRLALYYTTYLPAGQIAEAACPLLEASLRQGFAPPALAIAHWCQPYNASPGYREALEAVPSMATLYAPYYPQPATRLACNRTRPQGLQMQWGRQRDYQAEIYRLLAEIDPQQRQAYLHKAVDINGCAAAQQRLTSNR
ncbi:MULTISPECIES: sel1 repeat family protein [unclassified Pseudomonas]|uniref:sel1 repeat family protein n=1 Tax=unclassified Pseudomonas TaxID=196821 RepID=UPI00244B407E|nr:MULTISPECIES: sel1 repeat family protein [unclassified Pseudomonas]MDH0300755.1 sel1 repeat family protein [Pseudomonas sp. GD04091]MDH1985033.1 sel1 repeat family protein [Pseudomonas sp. GD03689]